MATLREEAFLDSEKIESVSGLSYGVNRPTKQTVADPLYETGRGTTDCDWQLGYASVANVDGAWKMWSVIVDQASTVVRWGHYTSTDGLAWTRPNLGRFTFNGNTNNPIFFGDANNQAFGRVYYLPDELPATPYVFVTCELTIVGGARSWPAYLRIYTSANGIDFTLIKTVGQYTYVESHGLLQRADGRWLVYYQAYNRTGTGRRDYGAFLSPSSNLADAAAWTDLGVILTSPSLDYEHYNVGTQKLGELYVMWDMIYDSGPLPHYQRASYNDDRIFKIALLVSRTGTAWTVVDDDWLACGTYPSGYAYTDGFPIPQESAWDGGGIICTTSLERVGNEWRHYYTACGSAHHDPRTRIQPTSLGYSTLGYQRLGKLSGTGNVVLDPIDNGVLSILSVNSNGSVQVELLDASNDIIDGYAKEDCDAISSDTYGEMVSWNGNSILPTYYKPKFYVTSGELFHVTVDGLTSLGFDARLLVMAAPTGLAASTSSAQGLAAVAAQRATGAAQSTSAASSVAPTIAPYQGSGTAASISGAVGRARLQADTLAFDVRLLVIAAPSGTSQSTSSATGTITALAQQAVGIARSVSGAAGRATIRLRASGTARSISGAFMGTLGVLPYISRASVRRAIIRITTLRPASKGRHR